MKRLALSGEQAFDLRYFYPDSNGKKYYTNLCVKEYRVVCHSKRQRATLMTGCPWLVTEDGLPVAFVLIARTRMLRVRANSYIIALKLEWVKTFE